MRLFTRTSSWIVFVASTLLLGVACYFMIFSIGTSSDVFIEEVWSRALLNRGPSAWYDLLFTFAPAYFPDFLGFFLSKLFFSNMIVKVYTATLFQIAMLIISMTVLFRSLDRKGLPLFTSILLITTGLILASAHYPGMWLWYYSTNDNLGASILAFFALALVLNNMKRPSLYKLGFLFLLSAFSIVNGKLFVITFVLPAAAALGIFTLYSYFFCKRDSRFITLCQSLAIVILSYPFANLILEPLINPYSTSAKKLASGLGAMPSLHNFFSNIGTLFGYHDFLLWAILMGWLISLVIASVYLLQQIKQIFFKKNKKIPCLAAIFILFALATIGLNWIGPIAAGVIYPDPGTFRYFFSLFIFPILVIVWQITETNTNHRLMKLNIVLLLICLLFAIRVAYDSRRTIDETLQIVPSSREARIAQCIDNAADKYHLQRGVSDYWNSYPISFLTHNNIEINPICNTLEPCVALDRYPFFPKNNDKLYDFILITHNEQFQFSAKQVLAHAPKPDVILSCPENMRLFIYTSQKNKLNAALHKQWNIFSFMYRATPKLIVTKDMWMKLYGDWSSVMPASLVVTPQTQTGWLYGALRQSLPAGKYKIDIMVTVRAQNPANHEPIIAMGFEDSTRPFNPVVHDNGRYGASFRATPGPQHFEKELQIPRNVEKNPWGFWIYNYGGGYATIQSVTLERLK